MSFTSLLIFRIFSIYLYINNIENEQKKQISYWKNNTKSMIATLVWCWTVEGSGNNYPGTCSHKRWKYWDHVHAEHMLKPAWVKVKVTCWLKSHMTVFYIRHKSALIHKFYEIPWEFSKSSMKSFGFWTVPLHSINHDTIRIWVEFIYVI